MSRRPCVAIDGPVAAGKGTIARRVAALLGYQYIDSGAMYRALAWAARRAGIARTDEEEAAALARSLDIKLLPAPGGGNRVFVGGVEVTDEIRSQEIGQLASQLSEIPAVRERLVAKQQEMARGGGVVMEGRDIQTVVLPQAEVKIFLTATAEERARRRHRELTERGVRVSFADVLAEVRQRDHRDSHRAHSPLRPAPDAVHVDTTGLSIDEVVERVMAVIREKLGLEAQAAAEEKEK